MDAGGTNFRVSTVYFNKDKQPIIENFQSHPMPGVEKEVTKEEFFATMAGYVRDIADTSSNIGFCFSYPTEISPNKDGRPIRFSKEIKAREVQGQMIGENLNAALASMGCRDPKHVVILNDTVTTLLAGRSASFGRTFDSYVGFILGTGTNCAYIESNKNIMKTPDLDPVKSQIINIESGGFAKAPMGTIDKEFDKSTKNPGEHTFEKMISGAYLGPLSLMTIHKAVEEDLFSAVACVGLNSLNELTTKDISDFLRRPKSPGNLLSAVVANRHDDLADLDFVVLLNLIESIVERAAKLTAINLSSALLKSGKGQDLNHPICIVAEGTTFYKLLNFKSKVGFYLKQYLEEQKRRFYEIMGVENATLIGAAIAGLTN
jgi:hexokinase